MKIYTKTGDDGKTSLFRGGRVHKDNLRIDTYGTIDELNSFLGLAFSEILDKEIKDVIYKIQNDLFVVGSELATLVDENSSVSGKIQNTSLEMVSNLEQFIDKFDTRIPELKSFILPGGSKGASILHIARTVCRRAERKVVTLAHSEAINEKILIYLNRLSDLLFVLSRYENFVTKTPDVLWEK